MNPQLKHTPKMDVASLSCMIDTLGMRQALLNYWNTSVDDELLSTKQAAKLANVTPYTMRRWVREKLIVATKINGSQNRIKKSDLMRFINGRAPDDSEDL